MVLVITGPYGQIAYLDTGHRPGAVYPALNLPCCAFARAEDLQAVNLASTPAALGFARRSRAGAAVAMLGEPVKRER